ncbi:MAG: hypothetical protein H6818_05340 [Phycisphaerales bacterium]|nr:hypothetical protein [Phycisphaerales bacterium]MCB9863391.1 hypothetical protein [Phycisphaerales bacterium]
MPTRKAKPNGVIGAEIWVQVGEAATRSQFPNHQVTNALNSYTFARLATRTPTVVEFTGADAGRTASYILRWVNTRGQPGGYCQPGNTGDIPALAPRTKIAS